MKFQKRTESPGGGSDKFLKLKDGESKTLILKGEIFEYHCKWDGKTYSPDPGGTSRFRINAIVYEEGKFSAKTWEFPVTVYNQLADINSEYPLDKTKIKLTRQGTGTDTVYHILPLVSEKDKLTPAIISQLDAVTLNILDTKPNPSPIQGGPSNGWDSMDPGQTHSGSDEDLPF